MVRLCLKPQRLLQPLPQYARTPHTLLRQECFHEGYTPITASTAVALGNLLVKQSAGGKGRASGGVGVAGGAKNSDVSLAQKLFERASCRCSFLFCSRWFFAKQKAGEVLLIAIRGFVLKLAKQIPIARRSGIIDSVSNQL